MKTLALALAAAATLIASSAFADEITGTIHTECLNGPTCFASITSIVGGVEHTTKLTGDFKQLGKLDGKIATVKGTSECLNGGDTCSMAVKSAKSAAAQPLTMGAPKAAFVTPASVGGLKPENNVLTGIVHTYCMNGADSCRATLTVGDQTYGLSGNFSKIAKFDGKIATVKGALAMCGAGMGGCGESIIVSSIHGAAAMPLTDATDAGNNVARDASTTASAADSVQAPSVGVGIKRN